MTKRDHLRTLARICRQFGGRLAVVSQREFDRLFDKADSDETPWDDTELSASPFTSNHGLWWSKKIIYAVKGAEEIGSIIHEMGHVFAAPHHPHHECSECAEWDWFGWEVAIARLIDAARTWSRHNDNYNTGNEFGGDWGKLSAKQRRAVVTDRLAHARKIGILDADGLPRSVR